MLTQGQIEEHIMALSEAMEDTTHSYAEVGQRAARAEADYRREHATLIVAQLRHREGRSVVECTATADAMVSDQRQTHLLAEAERNALREALLTQRSRMDALRTLAANVRAQT